MPVGIYDNVNAVVDGTFKAFLMDGDECVGEVYFALPYNGIATQITLEGLCADCNRFKDAYDVVFLPINLWAMETEYPVEQSKERGYRLK